MAPKKKKKAVSNPARGFATVSLPSKAKLNDANSEAESDQVEPKGDELIGSEPQSSTNVAASLQEPSALQDMTPDQLEAHFENAELQTLVEKSAERSKRDAARQIARLETERRTLRAQAMPLETDGWLTHGLVDEIIDLSKSGKIDRSRALSRMHPESQLQPDDLLVKLWTLQQVLKSLQINAEDQALKHVVSLSTDYILTSKDYIWGLEESFDRLALRPNPEDLPQYHLTSFAPTQNHGTGFLPSNQGSRAPSPSRIIDDHHSSPQAFETSQIGGPTRKNMSTEEHADVQSLSSEGTNDSTDEDNDPEELVSRYIDIKSRLLEHEPEFYRDQGHVLGIKAQRSLSSSQIRRLHQKIEKIERDLLFDHKKANLQWIETSNILRSDLAERRRKLLGTEQACETNPETESIQDSEVQQDNSSDLEDEDEGLFGDIFTTVEKYAPGRQDNAQAKGDASIVVLDFGKWAGISPRRVLEETCKARDTRCRISFHSISPSKFSNRHRVEIKWSRPQPQGISLNALPPRLSYTYDARTVNVMMQTIATSTAMQSEAYVSTVTLFALSGNESKEEKVFLRLPPVWRELWSELLQQRQAEITSADISTLKGIRIIARDAMPQGKGSENARSLTKEDEPRNTAESMSIPYTHNVRRNTPQQLQADWQKKSSTLRYQAMQLSRQQLPIAEHRGSIMRSIDAQQVTILCAETGAGKSTQVPAFILENEFSSGRDCHILVTQPRRISAMSLAKRVSEELGEARADIGTHRSLVGYAIRLESKTTSTTRITYATTGVLLRMLEASQNLLEITHLILDEVHERTLDLDLAFIAIKRLLARRPDLKVVLMSATVDSAKFSRYFEDAPILAVPGRTFPVEVRYLEDAIESTLDHFPTNGSQSLQAMNQDNADDFGDEQQVRSVVTGLESYNPKTRAIVATYDEYRIDYSLITNLAAVIASHKAYSRYSRAMLIFMPGIAEIRRLHNTFLSHNSFSRGWTFFLLHSSFSSEDLEMAFMPPPAGTRKIVIATNIAETGITIPDITAVIDTCKEKTMRFDERRQMSKLTENFTSKSSCRQRRGRAARVQDGLCFHLITRYRYECLLPEQHVPEMLRLSLQEPVLRVKIWGFGDIEETLSQAIDPPTSKNIRRAVEALKDSKALTMAESLTPLGRQLARLPLDIWLGKLAISGIVFRCVDAAVTIASILSSKSPFLTANRGDPRADNARLPFKRGDSDLLLSYNAYLAWRRTCKSGNVVEFSRKNFLDQQALSQIEDQKVQLLVALADARLLSLDEMEMSDLRRARASGRRREFFKIPDRYDMNSASDNALTSLVAVAFYPKLIVREGKGWRNVSTNQQVNLGPSSVNRATLKPPAWLSFHQTMQTKSKLPSVFDTSAVPESAIVVLLGDAEFKMFAGIIGIDGSKIRFRVRTWRVMIALKSLRTKVDELLTHAIQNPGISVPASLQPWANIWQQILAPVEQDVNIHSASIPRR